MFDSWMRILQQVDGSVLWLLHDNRWAEQNLRAEAARRGLDPGRLIFAQREPLPDHLARHRLADLFLDTTPYNAHTTASDALWAGLPLLTIRGSTFPGRVAASLLHAAGLPELVAPDSDAYERMAVGFAQDPAALQATRQKLASQRDIAPLFDIAGYARRIEAAFGAMHQRFHEGLPPEHMEACS
jgi:predicted O-linked N-acetylglucosamine transferase (SPINDLY family)